jgi:hypothetical protein
MSRVEKTLAASPRAEFAAPKILEGKGQSRGGGAERADGLERPLSRRHGPAPPSTSRQKQRRRKRADDEHPDAVAVENLLQRKADADRRGERKKPAEEHGRRTIRIAARRAHPPGQSERDEREVKERFAARVPIDAGPGDDADKIEQRGQGCAQDIGRGQSEQRPTQHEVAEIAAEIVGLRDERDRRADGEREKGPGALAPGDAVGAREEREGGQRLPAQQRHE